MQKNVVRQKRLRPAWHNLSNLKVPVIATVLGEGGSGGALGIGVADRVVMLSHSIYSVISPEGCASILWKTAEKAEQASEALALTAEKLQKIGIVEYVVDEGEGAHLNPEQVMHSLKNVLKEALDELQPMDANATMRSTLPAFNEVWQRQFRSSVLSQLQAFPAQTKFLIGCSGGMDSMLLLHLLSFLCPEKVRAIYIDHQLQSPVQRGALWCKPPAKI